MADPLKVECPHCGGSLKLKDRSANGKKVRCPKCQDVFKIQLPEEDEMEVLDDLEEDFGSADDFPEEEPVPKKASSKKSAKKKRKGEAKVPWAIIGIAAAVLFFVGGVGVLVSQFIGGSGANKIDMKYLLADANTIVHVNVKEVLESPLLAGILNQPQAQQMLNPPAGNQAFSFKEMVSITSGSKVADASGGLTKSMNPMAQMNGIGALPEADSHTVVVVRTSTPIAADKLSSGSSKLTPLTHNGQTYHKKVGEVAAGFGMLTGDCFYFPEPQIMVMAMEADIKQVIDQGAKQARRREFDIINPGMTLLMAVADNQPNNPNPTLTTAADRPELQAIERAVKKSLRVCAMGLKLTDHVDLEMLFQCADSAGAGELKTAVDGGVAELKTQYEKSKQMLQLMGMEEVMGLADKILASIKVELSGSQVTTVAMIPSEVKTVGESLAALFRVEVGSGRSPHQAAHCWCLGLH